MGFDLTTQPEGEASLGNQLDVIRAVRQIHRISSEPHHNAGSQFNCFGRLSHKGEHCERVVARFGNPQTVVTDLFLFAGLIHNPVKPTIYAYAAIDFHRPELSSAQG